MEPVETGLDIGPSELSRRATLPIAARLSNEQDFRLPCLLHPQRVASEGTTAIESRACAVWRIGSVASAR